MIAWDGACGNSVPGGGVGGMGSHSKHGTSHPSVVQSCVLERLSLNKLLSPNLHN